MDNLENPISNFENVDVLAVDNSLNQDILFTDNNLPGSFQDSIVTESFQISPLPQSALSKNVTENGVFTINSTGEFTIDFLFDAGGYQSELGIFNLTGMESLNPGSDEYIQEAARRVLSNSTNGYIVVNDDSEGAKFTGELAEKDRNKGDYQGVKTFSMNPGDNFALMLVPQGKVAEVLDNSVVDDDKRPLFSLASANPENAIQMMQLVEGTVDGGVFGMEDLRLDKNSDTDYNDIIFHVKGAAGKATTFQEVSSNNWDETEVGKKLIEFARDNNKFNQTLNNQNSGKLQFEKAEFNTFESGISTLSAKVIRSEGNLGNVSATVNLTNGTAIAGEDFDNTPIVLNFSDGEIEKNVTIPIFSDDLKEGRETVNLSLANLTGGAVLGNKNTAILNIGDEDTSNIISQTSSEDSALSLDTVNVFLKPNEEINFELTVTVPEASANIAASNSPTPQNANSNQINITPVGDDAGYIKEISPTKIEVNSTTYNVKLASDGSGGNQTMMLQADNYGSTTVNAITGIQGPYTLPPNLTDSTLAVQGFVTGGSEEGVLFNQQVENNPSLRKVGFLEVNNPTEAEQTWLIIHGWNDAPEGKIADVAQEIANTKPGDRVLLLDWREAAYNNSESLGVEFGVPGRGNFRAATWISPVAEFAVKALNDFYGISTQSASQSLNLIGHSLGSLVNAEMGRIYRDGLLLENNNFLSGNTQGARTITALDPPSARNRDENPLFDDPDEDIYDVDGRVNGIQAPEKFADVSAFSRSFVGEKSIAGNPELAITADEAFQMDFGTISEFATDFGSEHGRVVRAFTNTINQPGLIGDLLGIRAYDSIDELPIEDFDKLRIRQEDNGAYKGIIDVNKDNEAVLLIGKAKTGNKDDIVIGSFVNQEINGAEFLGFGGDGRYTGDGNDLFFGEAGNDTLISNDNDDILFGGIGKDKLNGGSGKDTFIFKPGDGGDNKDAVDTIEDFEPGTDKIGLINLEFGQLTFQEFRRRSGLFGNTTDTAIIANSEFLALVEDVEIEEIRKPEYFVAVDEKELRVS
jgi:pimeloyl-ACP methyl ester carboxylesterase